MMTTTPTNRAMREVAERNAPDIPPRSTALECVTLRSFAEIESIREVWSRLHQHPHADLDFFRLVAETTEDAIRPHVFVVRSGEAIRAILVGRVEMRRIDVRSGYLHMPAPRIRTLTMIHGGLLGNPSAKECELLADGVMTSLKKKEYYSVYFNHLDHDSPLYHAIRSRTPRMMLDFCPVVEEHWYLTLTETFDEFLKMRVSKHYRWRIRQKRNRFHKVAVGQVEVDLTTRPEEVDQTATDIEVIAAKGYLRALGAGFKDSPNERQRLKHKAERGKLLIVTLRVGGSAWAYTIGTASQGVLYLDYTGYDPQYKACSPGNYLLMHLIEKLCDDKLFEVQAIDFGTGDAQYKEGICDRRREDISFWIFPGTPAGVALNTYRTILNLANVSAKKLLGKEVQGRVKKKWRDLMRSDKSAEKASLPGGVPSKGETERDATAETD